MRFFSLRALRWTTLEKGESYTWTTPYYSKILTGLELAELSESEELPLPLEDEDDEDEEEEEVVLEPEVLPLSLGLGGIVRFLKLNLLSRIFHFGDFT